MNLKKIISLCLLFCFCITFTSCSGINYITTEKTNYNVDKQINSVETTLNTARKSGTVAYLTPNKDNLNKECLRLFEDLYNGNLIVNITTSSSIYDDLKLMKNMDNTPDLVSNDESTFPFGVYNNYYEKLDEYIDLSTNTWEEVRFAAENFRYKGNIYYVPHSVGVNKVLAYDYDLFVKYDIPNPYDLLMQNSWTWEELSEILGLYRKAFEDSEGIVDFSVLDFVSSTGEKLIDFHDDKVTSNIKNTHISIAYKEINSLIKNKFISNEKFDLTNAFSSPKNAFYSMNINEYEELMRTNGKNIQFVPYPKSDMASRNFASAKTEGFLVPKGAKNIKGAVDWIVMNRLFVANPQNIVLERKKALNGLGFENPYSKPVLKNWSEEMYNLKISLYSSDEFEHVFENIVGLSPEIKMYTSEILENATSSLPDNFDSSSFDKWAESDQNATKLESFLAPYR